ncbi:hypothetical protein GH714_026613 [Hevea brasiliensis]|uniref:Uncharacterized protein n=1 Tax=Hevea brasiliensis TaxID=3981 RepID=A0A6A6NAL2_HEVBR|nr:hypothetical protein GH714_026613 [Hevea brasiliensis]
MAIARWFYDAYIPFNAWHSPYFQLALDAVIAIGPRYKGPSYNDIRFLHFYSMCTRLQYEKRTCDPIDYECIEKIDFWIVEEEPPPELDTEELEEALYQEDAILITEKSSKSTCTQEDPRQKNDSELNVLEYISLESFGIIPPNNSTWSNIDANNFMESNPPLIERDESGSDNDKT